MRTLIMKEGFLASTPHLTTVIHYLASARKAFSFKHPQRTHVCFCIDGSTIGNKGRLIGYFTKADNTGAFAPPVVRHA